MNQLYGLERPDCSSISGVQKDRSSPRFGTGSDRDPSQHDLPYSQQSQYQMLQEGEYRDAPDPQYCGYRNLKDDSKNRNLHQICRKDAKNCFVESLKDSFNFGRVHFNFASYDLTRPTGSRQTGRVSIYISVGELLDLCRRMENNEILWTIQQARRTGVIPPPIFESLGGTSAWKLAMRGKQRLDGRSESRVMQVCVGRKADLVLSAKSGPGDESGKGLIVPKFGNTPENSVAVPMSYSLFCQLLLETRVHYQAWLCAQYKK